MKRIKLFLSMLVASVLLPTGVLAQEPIVVSSTFTQVGDYYDMEGTSVVFGHLLTSEENDWAFACEKSDYPQKTSVGGSFALTLGGKTFQFYTGYNLKGYIKKITVRAGGNLSKIKGFIGGRSDNYDIGTIDVTSSDVKDYNLVVDASAGEASLADYNYNVLRRVYVEITPGSGSGATVLESITIEYVDKLLEEGTYGTIGDLTWYVENLTVFPPTYRLIVTGTGVMPDFKQVWVNGQGKSDAPWTDFEITEVEVKEGVSSIGNYTFYKQSVGSISLPSTITRIGDYALQLNTFSSINLPEGLVSIGTCALADNSSLQSITIPTTVSSFGMLPFGGCSALKTIAVKDGNVTFESPNNCNAIIKKDGKELIVGCQNTVIPADVRSIGQYAFMSTALESIEIPAGVTKIGNGAFQSCQKLTSLVLLDNVVTIGANAFRNCEGMTTLTIGNGITSIGANAFGSMGNLSDIYCTANPENLTWDGNNDASCCKSDGTTKFHVADPAAWKAKFPDAHVQFVDMGSAETSDGDVSGDGKTDADDVTALMSYLMGTPPAGFNAAAADVNGDGKVDVADIVALVNKLLGK